VYEDLKANPAQCALKLTHTEEGKIGLREESVAAEAKWQEMGGKENHFPDRMSNSITLIDFPDKDTSIFLVGANSFLEIAMSTSRNASGRIGIWQGGCLMRADGFVTRRNVRSIPP
jgi:hypothetical protein